ncbi:MAG: prenyltransferase [Planctomycetes bacterium]|nr:prenyltransferase [Planctomycetota bacterium]
MVAVLGLLPASLFSQEPLRQHDALITEEASQSIQRGLAYLVEQQLDDGSFGTSGYSRNVAVCALGGMAWLASGSTPGRGPYGEQIDRCIDYLLENTNDQGFIAADDATSRGPMYGHGFATLFLCETYGMAATPELRDRLDQIVELIINSQNEAGGWRYQPLPSDADLSVTVCQVMALRAARNAGITVPRETIDRAMAYVKGCQNEDGGYRYMLNQPKQASQFARSAAGVVALYNAGIYEGEELQRGLDYLEKFLPTKNNPGRETFYSYGQYYAVQAMWHAGGERWQRWYPELRDELLARQRKDGSWMDSICPEYGTAMACIVLQVPNNYLPILQR